MTERYMWYHPVLAILPIGTGSNRGKITVKVVLACTCVLWLDGDRLPCGHRRP